MTNPDCPVCLCMLKSKSTSHGRVWHCSKCNGILVNVGLLKKLKSSDAVNQFWRESTKSPKFTLRKCSYCMQPFTLFTADCGFINVDLDICKTCQVIWFDSGEFNSVPSQPNTLPRTAKQEIAKIEVEERTGKSMSDEEYRSRQVIRVLNYLFFWN